MSREGTAVELVLGGEPRVHLLPPEVTAGQKGKTLRRVIAGTVVGTLVLLGAGIGVASWQADQAKQSLLAAQARSADLLASQLEYSGVLQVQATIDAAIAARKIGTASEIDWKGYLDDIRAVLPADVTVDSVTIESTSPLVPYSQPTAPLQESRVATVNLTLTSPGLPPVPDWLEGFQSLPGYADSWTGSISRTDAGGYTVDVTVHVNADAYLGRFAEPTEVK
jgi:hypothetical protein